METLHGCTEKLPQDPLSDFSIWRRFIEYRKKVQWDDILAQVEELESNFDRNKAWKRFVKEPVIDQYGQVWMIWENPATSSSNSKDQYQVYKIPKNEDEFRYAFIKELEVDRYPKYHKTSYEFFVGPDDGRDETITVFFNDDGVIEYVHCYSYLEERKRLYEKHERA